MPWTNQELQSHLRAAKLLDKIKDQSFDFIRKNPTTTESAVQKFIQHLFRKNNLRLAEHSPIVAFGRNTSEVHHFSTSSTQHLSPNTPILIDLWTRSNKIKSPFADITWMGFYTPKFSKGKLGRVYGHKIPSEFQKIFNVVIQSRDTCLKYLQTELKKGKIPTGAELDDVARNVIKKAGYGKNFTHSTGHSLGFVSPHGKEEGLSFRNSKPLEINLGFTIEPGIYLKNRFGARSEIDFYISKSHRLIVTSPAQKRIVVV